MSKKICILDYGLGNILSLKYALSHLGYKNSFFNSENENKVFDCLIIPGVGSFSQAVELIKKKNLKNLIDKSIENNLLVIGICLGMQILFKKGFENGESYGLDYFDGDVTKMSDKKIIKLPHIGWKKTSFFNDNVFNHYSGEKFYYVHSYECKPLNQNDILADSKYNNKSFTAAVKKNNILGFQFHPEKSGTVGLDLLKDTIKNKIN